MILSEFGPAAAYRMHTPRWATAPTSGAGAATHGVRVNRVGVPALYLSLEPETAIREYQQLSRLMPPGTLVSYTLHLAPVVDFRGGYVAGRWSSLWEEFHCDWRELWFNQGVEPPSWVLGDESRAAGAKGVLFPSKLATGGANLVVFTEQLAANDVLQVYDPAQSLPKNQDSWR
jgi:RES domain-containing protein